MLHKYGHKHGYERDMDMDTIFLCPCNIAGTRQGSEARFRTLSMSVSFVGFRVFNGFEMSFFIVLAVSMDKGKIGKGVER